MSFCVDLDPASLIVFHGDFCSATATTLSIKNLSGDKTVIYKMKTNCPHRYVVKPHRGQIKPNATQEVVITLLPFHYKESETYNDKFLIQTCLLSKMNLEYTKHDFWTMVPKEEQYERKLRCIFKYNVALKIPQPSPADKEELKPFFEQNGRSEETLDVLIQNGDEFVVRERLLQAKEQIKQLIRQGNELRKKNQELENDISESKTKLNNMEVNKENVAQNESNVLPFLEGDLKTKIYIAGSCLIIMWFGMLLGKYIM